MGTQAHQGPRNPAESRRRGANFPPSMAALAPFLATLAAPMSAQQPPVAPSPDPSWSLHAQTTFIDQMHPGFNAPYSGMNSLDPEQESAHTVSLTLFLGRALWPGAALYYDPEVTQGEGLSDTTGIAGFPNGEGSRASSKTPQYATARLFIRQVINLGGGLVEGRRRPEPGRAGTGREPRHAHLGER